MIELCKTYNLVSIRTDGRGQILRLIIDRFIEERGKRINASLKTMNRNSRQLSGMEKLRITVP